MFLIDQLITPTGVEKLTFLAALIIAVVWLWKEIATLNKKRDADLLLWRDTYEKVMDKLIALEKDSTKAIQQNTQAIEQFSEVLEKVHDKLK